STLLYYFIIVLILSVVFFLTFRQSPVPTLFPYTTLFRSLLAVVASVALLATSAGPAPAPSLVARTDPPPLGATGQRHWVGAWATAPVRERHDERRVVRDQSFRMVARLTLGGPRLRVRLSNVYGSAPVTFTQVRVALRVAGPAV